MIYFITAREAGAVKIGYAQNPHARLLQIQVSSPYQLAIERVLDAPRSEEKKLHHLFSGYRLRGEWFRINTEIENFMSTLSEYERPEAKAKELRLSMDDIKNEIAAFCQQHSLSGARFGELALGDASFWFKLSRGRDPKYSTVLKVREFMANYGE